MKLFLKFLFFPLSAYVPMVQAPVMPVVMATAPVVSSSVKTGMWEHLYYQRVKYQKT